MGADQQFCLRWNNFHTNITSAFESLRDDEDFVDITLACEGKQVKAHKMVLSACSPYFRNLLKGNPCQHPIVFLKDVTFANLSSILDFMYHGEVNVSHNELATFLKTAEALKVRGLAEDDKKKDTENCTDSNSPLPNKDPPDPGSPKDETSTAETRLSESPPPPSKRRRRSGGSVQSAEDTCETVLSDNRECASVKNEPQDIIDEDEIINQTIETENIKSDIHNDENNTSEERNFGLSESVTISRSQAAMQQLQESFGSFLPGMNQSPGGFMSHGANEISRPPFSMEGVQGLPPGISSLPGPSMSQGASQDSSQDCNVVKVSSAVNSPTYSASPSSSGMVSGPMTVEPPTKVSPLDDNNQVQIKQEFSPSMRQRSSSREFSPDISSIESFAQSMAHSPSFQMGYDRQIGSSSGSFNVSSSMNSSGSFSPNSGQVLSPQFARQRTNTGDEVQCNICGRTLCNKYVLKVHMRDMHSPRQNHQCPLCKRCYSSLNSLRVHLSTIHKTGGLQPQ